MRKISAAAALFVFWILLSGLFTPFLLAAGAVSAIAVVAFARRLELVDPEGHPVDLTVSALRYVPWLFVEVVKSAWQVATIVVHPRLPISPVWVLVKPSQVSAVGRVIYANSITLTPGTITVVAGRDEFLVHALTRDGAEGLAEGAMDRRVSRIEGER